MIEILSSGAPNLIQDLGRWGYLKIGVSRSGAMDLQAFAVANALVGNAENAAAIEIGLFPFRVRFEEAAAFACTGAQCPVHLDGVSIPPWWSRSAQAGQTLVIGAPVRGARAYLAIRGGIDVAPVLGSRSTDQKNGIGGFAGRGLRRGDKLAVDQTGGLPPIKSGLGAIPSQLSRLLSEVAARSVTIRCLIGTEFNHFTAAAQRSFESSEYTITPDANRMGYRLSGEALALVAPLELLSHGIVPGTIQVPPSGQPIVQLAEANTCGGYPKIGNVIEADLWRLAQAPVGCKLKFRIVSAQHADEELRAQATERALIRRNLAFMQQRA